MKLPVHAYKTWWDVHAWAGVLVSIVANAIFFTGVVSLLRNELTVWQDPRFHAADGRCEPALIEPAVHAAIRASGVTPSSMLVSQLDVPCAPIVVDVEAEGAETSFVVDRETGRIFEERSVVSAFLFNLHYLYDPYVFGMAGMYLAGILGVALLLVLLTGLLIHLKDFVRQLHQLRPRKPARVAWSDAHKVLGVMGLPFQTMMIATGAIVCLASPIYDAWQYLVFDGDPARAERAMYGFIPLPSPTGREATRVTMDELAEQARAQLPGLDVRTIWLQHAGDESAHATIRGRIASEAFGAGEVIVGARDGRVLASTGPSTRSAMQTTTDWIYGLHFGWFGGLALRLLYALLGLTGCVTILSGNWIWLARRDPARRRKDNRALAIATLGGGLGIAPAVAAMLLVNRLAPIDAPWHAASEVIAFVVAWAGSFVVAALARSELSAARQLLLGAAAMFAITPLVSAFRTPLSLVRAIQTGAADIASVEIGMLALALVLLGCVAMTRRGDLAPARSPKAVGIAGGVDG